MLQYEIVKALDKILQKRKTLCFLDLEGTQFSHEMIAIGAVKVDLRKDHSVKKTYKGYYTLVKPKNRIGKVVTDLTGITEAQVKKDGISFRRTIENVKRYMGRSFTKCLFVTFGNHDQRIMAQSLAYNMDANKEDVQFMIKHSFDFAEFMSQYVRDENGNALSLANMLKVFNIDFKGQQHNALADTLNLVYLYDAMIKHRDILSREYRKVLGQMRHLPEPVHQLILQLLEEKSVSPTDFSKMIEDALK